VSLLPQLAHPWPFVNVAPDKEAYRTTSDTTVIRKGVRTHMNQTKRYSKQRRCSMTKRAFRLSKWRSHATASSADCYSVRFDA